MGYANLKPRKTFMPYEAATRLMIEEKIFSDEEFRIWCRQGKRPSDFPSNPDKFYSEWVSWSKFFAPARTSVGWKKIVPEKRQWMSYEAAKHLMTQFGILKERDLRKFTKSNFCPDSFPSQYHKIYRQSGYNSKDFFSYAREEHKEIWEADVRIRSLAKGERMRKRTRKQFVSFKEACEILRKYKIKSQLELTAMKKKYPVLYQIPSQPRVTYGKEFSYDVFYGRSSKG